MARHFEQEPGACWDALDGVRMTLAVKAGCDNRQGHVAETSETPPPGFVSSGVATISTLKQ